MIIGLLSSTDPRRLLILPHDLDSDGAKSPPLVPISLRIPLPSLDVPKELKPDRSTRLPDDQRDEPKEPDPEAPRDPDLQRPLRQTEIEQRQCA